MESRIEVEEACIRDRVREGFVDHMAESMPLPSSLSNVRATGGIAHEMAGNCEPNTVLSESQQAQQALDNAPPISSLLSNYTNMDNIQNECVPLPGGGSLAAASALLRQSLDSGSLTGNTPKNEQNQLHMASNMAVLSPLITETEINNVSGSSIGTGTSSEDNSKQDQQLQVRHDRKPAPESEPASSYMEMTARSNINERLADFNSTLTLAEKKATLPYPSNDLNQSMQGACQPVIKQPLPKNISAHEESVSLNRDISMTLPKYVTNKSTQTDPSGQDQDRYGGASAAGTSDQSMTSGPTSSLPSDDVLVRKLKRPIIQWLQRKLETNIGMAWQDLVDLHDWDYDRITDFESSCSGKSPFCMLLAEPEFQMYRMRDLKRDLEQLPRKDILYDLDDVMRRHYK